MSLREFLIMLATDASQLAAFRANKVQFMQDIGLTSEESALVIGHDEDLIRKYIQEREPDASQTFPFMANGVAKPEMQEHSYA